jgi:hypothetical protein
MFDQNFLFRREAMIIRRLTVIAIALALISAWAGCGGSGGDTGGATVTTSNLTKAVYIKKVSGICEQTRHKLLKGLGAYEEREAASSKPVSKRVEEVSGSVFLPGIEREIEEIRTLGAPQGDEQVVEAMLAGMQKGVAIGKKRLATSIDQFSRQFHAFDKVAGPYGLEACLFGGSQ